MFLDRFPRVVPDCVLTWISRIASAVLSNRGIALWLLAGCTVLAVGPWLRPPLSRDLRGVHIPWGELVSPSFAPEVVSETPRPWRWNSIATPLLVVIAGGAVVVLPRPRWISRVFGLLLALTLPSMAVVLWNYPTLIESFESEMRDRALLRTVFRQHSEHMLSAGASNRLKALSDKSAREDSLLMRQHPMLLPLRYTTYGTWLVGVALIGIVVATPGAWTRRLAFAGAWFGIGVSLACAATWPRWLAEYHCARAEARENAREFAAAARSLESAKAAMPSIGNTRRYWLAKGRLSFRRQEPENAHQAFFTGHQAMLSGDLDRARALVERYVSATEGTTVERDLLAGIIARRAAEYVSTAKYSAAELSWSEAAAIAPWKSAYDIAHSAAELSAAPQFAGRAEQEVLPRLKVFGDLMVTSDFHSLLGDAYFVAGDFTRAREMYARAISLFHLPKYTNIPAQEGRLGM